MRHNLQKLLGSTTSGFLWWVLRIGYLFFGAQVDNMPWALSRPRRANSLQMHCLLWLLKDAIRSGGDGFSEPGVVYGDRTEEFSPKSSGRFSSYTCLRWLEWSVLAAAFSWILIVTLMSFFPALQKGSRHFSIFSADVYSLEWGHFFFFSVLDLPHVHHFRSIQVSWEKSMQQLWLLVGVAKILLHTHRWSLIDPPWNFHYRMGDHVILRNVF